MAKDSVLCFAALVWHNRIKVDVFVVGMEGVKFVFIKHIAVL